jgi:TonB-linked SusC/RagA family outer membrane protein
MNNKPIKSFKLKFLLLTAISLFTSNAYSQNLKIKGTITGDNSLLPGVSVSVKGEQIGSVSDFDGNYRITAVKGDILVFSYIGFKTFEAAVTGASLDVNLVSDVSKLDEVVVVGYGSVKRKDLTGAVSTIKSDEIEKINTTSFEGAIAAKAAGVQVVRSEGGPDAAFKIRIRGGTSINASNDPLYVVDGFPLTGGGVNTSTEMGNSVTSPLATLDPSNIASIDILKDASATAIYGSRGANGVIIITTKQGRPGTSRVSFESFLGISSLSRKLPILDAQGFIDFRNEYQRWDPIFLTSDPGSGQAKYLAEAFRTPDPTTGYYIPMDLASMTFDPPLLIDDWQNAITRTAITKNYKLSASGGNKKTRYNAALSYQDREGIIKTSGLERYTGNFNITSKVNDKLQAGFNGNIGYIKRSGVVSAATDNNNGRAGVVTNAILFQPIQSPRQWPENEYDPETGRLIANRNGDVINPMLMLSENSMIGVTNQTRLNAFVSYEVAQGLTYKASVRGYSSSVKNKAWFSERFGWSRALGGKAVTSFFNSASLATEQSLNYLKDFGNHRLNAVLVYERQKNTSESLRTGSTGFSIPGYNLDGLQDAITVEPTVSNAFESSIESFLARVQYDAFNKYLLTASLRYDGSSRFASGDKQWGYFPSVGLAWRISNEPFLKGNSVISDAKFKFSFGESGNTQIPTFQSKSAADGAGYIFNGNTLTPGASIIRLANDNLSWEKTREVDFGLTLGLFNNRITMEADYYDKETKDLLLAVPLPVTSGYKTAFKNLGLVSNKGFEFSLNADIVDKRDFKWNMNFNLSTNKNEVLDLGEAEEFFITSIGGGGVNNDYIIRVGEALGSIHGLAYDGVYNYEDFVEFDGMTLEEATRKFRADEAALGDAAMWWTMNNYTLKDGVPVNATITNGTYRPGMTKFKDTNADGVINDDDRHIIGNTLPKHFGGMTQNISYKNIDFTVQTSWSYGNDVYNKTMRKGSSTSVPWRNKFDVVKDAWTPDNPSGTWTGFSGGGPSGDIGSAAYDVFIEDGSFFRIANMTLGYKLPKNILRQLRMSFLRLYVSVDNIHVWTKYSGWDPDVSVGNNQLTPGLDADAYPRAKTFRTGIIARF